MTKVLCIDDDVDLTEFFSEIMKQHWIDALIANDGATGIDLIRSESPDLVLLDLMMPGMDGWAACTEIRTFSKVPIIIVSALDRPGMVVKALDAGADDYLIKPISGTVLIAHIHNLIRRAYAERQKTLIRARKYPTQPLPIG